MTLMMDEVDVPGSGMEDEAPDTESPGYDPEAPYGRTATGRIRKKPVASRTSATTGRSSAKNETRARQAASAIVQLNAFAVVGCLTAGLTETGQLLMGREEKFRDDLYNAFVLDPSLADYVLKMGSKSGKMMLIAAIGLHVGSVVPTAFTEYREMSR